MKYTNHHANVCVYVASIPAKNSRVSVTPWCNHSFHNAVQPAAGHAGCPCWGILGVSACWYWRTEINRWVRIIPSWIATVQSIQLHMLNSHHYTEHTFFSSGYHASFLFHVFLPFLPGHVIMSLTSFLSCCGASTSITAVHVAPWWIFQKRHTALWCLSIPKCSQGMAWWQIGTQDYLYPGPVCVCSSSFNTTHISRWRSLEFMREGVLMAMFNKALLKFTK